MSVFFLGYFKNLILLVISPECYDIFFTEYNILHVPCLKASFSKTLGYGIIAGSVLVKVPQILKIIRNQSAEGISIPGQILELYGITASVAYNYVKRFPFSSWGDGVFMLAQTSTIAGLSLHYNKGNGPCFLFFVFYSVILYVTLSGAVTADLLWTFQATSVPVMFAGKMIQAFQNYCNKSMGQQSLITILLLFLGSLARVFTSVQETGDFIIILTYSLASFANGILFSQFFIYPSNQKGVKKTSRSKKQLQSQQQRSQPLPKKKKQS